MARKRYGVAAADRHPVRVNVRLRRVGAPTRPRDQEVWDVLEELRRTGRVRRGWEIAAVDWQAHRAASDSFTGWRHGDVSDLLPSDRNNGSGLLNPVLVGDVVRLGWEPRVRYLTRTVEVPWERFRLAPGQRSGKYRPGQWVSDAYAARYPGKVRGVRGHTLEVVEEDVLDYEAELRVDYE